MEQSAMDFMNKFRKILGNCVMSSVSRWAMATKTSFDVAQCIESSSSHEETLIAGAL